MPQSLTGFYLGRRAYRPTFQLMQELFEARRQGTIDDCVLLLEHEAVITLGRGAKLENLLASPEQLKSLGVEVIETGRGGDVTLHAPGQLIAYPIIDLNPDRRDVRKYVQALTQSMRSIVAPYGIDGGTIADLIGLWIDLDAKAHWPGEEQASTPAKIGAIGVRISRWITQHGFALNLTTDLGLFQLIVPCGISDRGVCSLQSLCGVSLPVRTAAELALGELNERLGNASAQFVELEKLPDSSLKSGILGHFSIRREIPQL